MESPEQPLRRYEKAESVVQEPRHHLGGGRRSEDEAKLIGGSEEEEQLKAKRREWEEATAKRVHVVVRSRPLSIKEIKADSKVNLCLKSPKGDSSCFLSGRGFHG